MRQELEMEVKEIKSKVIHATILRNLAILRRTFNVDLEEGENTIKLINLETTIDSDSIRIYTTSKSIVQNIEYHREKVVTEVEEEKLKAMIKKLRELEGIKKKVENELDSMNQLLKSIDNSVQKTISVYGVGAITGETTKDSLKTTLDSLLKLREKKLGEIIKREEFLQEISAEIESLKTKISETQQARTVEIGVISLDITTPSKGKAEFFLEYHISGAYWKPTYDLHIESKMSKLLLFAEIIQRTHDVWEDVELMVSTKVIKPVEKPRLDPWYIYPVVRYPPRPTMFKVARAEEKKMMKKAVKEEFVTGAEEEFEEEEKMAVEVAEEVRTEDIITYRVKQATIEPDKPRLILLQEYELEITQKYVWDAYEYADPVLLAEFVNKDLLLPSGTCRIFKDNVLMGKTHIPRTLPGQKIEWAVSWVTDIETKREIISRTERKKGFLKDKAYVEYKYRLKIINHRKEEAKISVFDRIPVPRDAPDVDISDIEYSEEPKSPKKGVIQWDLTLKPDEKREIVYQYKVVFPRDLELSNLP